MNIGYRVSKIGLAAVVCCAMLAGCQSGSTANQTTAAMQEGAQTAQTAQGSGTSLANPWQDMTAAELLQATGTAFGLPAGAKNVHYRYLESEKLAEADFEWEDLNFTARRQPESGFEDISGMYYNWVLQNDVKIGSFSGKTFVTLAEQQTVNVCMWYDTEEEMMYSLAVIAADLDGFDITSLAEEMAGADRPD